MCCRRGHGNIGKQASSEDEAVQEIRYIEKVEFRPTGEIAIYRSGDTIVEHKQINMYTFSLAIFRYIREISRLSAQYGEREASKCPNRKVHLVFSLRHTISESSEASDPRPIECSSPVNTDPTRGFSFAPIGGKFSPIVDKPRPRKLPPHTFVDFDRAKNTGSLFETGRSYLRERGDRHDIISIQMAVSLHTIVSIGLGRGTNPCNRYSLISNIKFSLYPSFFVIRIFVINVERVSTGFARSTTFSDWR